MNTIKRIKEALAPLNAIEEEALKLADIAASVEGHEEHPIVSEFHALASRIRKDVKEQREATSTLLASFAVTMGDTEKLRKLIIKAKEAR